VTAKIARGAQGRPKPKSKSAAARKKAAQPKLLDAIPFPAETIRRVSAWIFGGMLLALAFAIAIAMQLPQTIGTARRVSR
jgi:predicted outer membrane lipoprotein